MKIKKIEKLIKERKSIFIYTDGENQWLGDGCSAYLVSDMPSLEPEELLKLFDISDEKILSFNCKKTSLPSGLNFSDNDPAENLIKCEQYHICTNGGIFAPILTSEGYLFLDIKYLKPFKGDIEDVSIYERRSTDGKVYFVAKSGFLVVGILLPTYIPTDKIKEWARKISELIYVPDIDREEDADDE